jgi:hypothetical protein
MQWTRARCIAILTTLAYPDFCLEHGHGLPIEAATVQWFQRRKGLVRKLKTRDLLADITLATIVIVSTGVRVFFRQFQFNQPRAGKIGSSGNDTVL